MATKYLWRAYGTNNILVDADGKPWYCEHCPCAPCLLAIEQRQKAKGITNPWSAGSPTNVANLIDTTGATGYTLDQLKAYVNALCAGTDGCFIAGPYSGGASAPTWLAATYANSATTVDELCALVAAMVYTRRNTAFTDTEYRTGTFQATLVDAIASFESASWTVGVYWNYMSGRTYVNGSIQYVVHRDAAKMTVTGLTTDVAHAAKAFVSTYQNANFVWADEGQNFAVATGVYTRQALESFASAAVASRTTAKYGRLDGVPPTTLVSDPPPAFSVGGWYLWADTDKSFWVLEWDFTA